MDSTAGRKKRRRVKKRRRAPESAAGDPSPTDPAAQKKPKRGADEPAAKPSSTSRLLDKIRARLSGGHFRMLNEKLYTCSGHEAFNLFKKDPELFNVYHTGYQQQMAHWPEQPVNVIIKWLKDRNPSLTVADFGCGNAILSRTVKNKVYSIDLMSNDRSVIACDMAHTPLDSSSVDVAVFCLSLMGTDFPDYLLEASRVLKPWLVLYKHEPHGHKMDLLESLHEDRAVHFSGKDLMVPCGWLLIAEVRSRFDPTNGGADPDKFSLAIQKLGFSMTSKDFNNKMFFLFYFKKKVNGAVSKNIKWPKLKPCLYKRR